MKLSYYAVSFLLWTSQLFQGVTSCNVDPWINEIHYDNVGGDVGEFIEIASAVPTDLSNYQVVLYNGSGRARYATIPLSGTATDSTPIAFYIQGIQNGSPDGICLYNTLLGQVVQFLSYEGTFTAINDLCNGVRSTNIGVSETGSTPVGLSLQLQGMGFQYSDFVWASNVNDTPGSPNQDQTIACPSAAPSAGPTVAPTAGPTDAPTPGPTVAPTPGPSAAPTAGPTAAPTPLPSAAPTPIPTAAPTAGPTVAPTLGPTVAPTPDPSAAPTPDPSAAPTPLPSAAPTPIPTATLTAGPTVAPTPGPTVAPTPGPTAAPTAAPSPGPTANPTFEPTFIPTFFPTSDPSLPPTEAPVPGVTPSPVAGVTPSPVVGVTPSPTDEPVPSGAPTEDPTEAPVPGATPSPVVDDTEEPSPAPSGTPLGGTTEAPVPGPTPAPVDAPVTPEGTPTASPIAITQDDGPIALILAVIGGIISAIAAFVVGLFIFDGSDSNSGSSSGSFDVEVNGVKKRGRDFLLF